MAAMTVPYELIGNDSCAGLEQHTTIIPNKALKAPKSFPTLRDRCSLELLLLLFHPGSA